MHLCDTVFVVIAFAVFSSCISKFSEGSICWNVLL